ncbi:outer membrane beta-barrel family protein [Rufibacter latericius]|uniref:TonB-dependent receptor n=1 Tax=Rufibacter latericius TaxID=2487040 RepID=A0A3M9MLM8_9BACT|nr:outer membrane beta-barrel family protein [Rufibacter latericius]RNI26460.1 TonB-dependent receptor [Rufibacter latericius]
MKKRTLFLLGQLCLCLYFSAGAWAQVNPATPVATAPKGPGKISGVVTDSLTGKPVEYTTVSLLQKGSKKSVDGTLTDARGNFSFTGVLPGEYSLLFSFIGYESRTRHGIVVSEQAPEVVVGKVILNAATTKLKEVTVEGLRPTITQEADKMVVSVEGTALAAGRTAYDVLARAPGVFIDQEGNIQLNGRAGVTVMLDGKLTYLAARDLRTLLEGMPAENLKNIEIIANPSAKFDAEGASGILNINLKKNEIRGMNGSLYAGYNYNGYQHAYSSGASLNYKTGKWNTFLTLDQARRTFGRQATFTRVFYGEEQTTYFDQVAYGNTEVQGPPSVRVGSDYDLTEKHSIGVMGYFVTNTLHGDFLTDTYLGNAPSQANRYIDANNFNTNKFTNYTGNVHYRGKLDTAGTTLSADLDLVKITNRGYANFYNKFVDLTGTTADSLDYLYTDTPNGYNIYAGKVDYSHPYAKGKKFEVGLKASRVEADNDSRFFFNNAEALELDLRRTNHFLYDENIYAGYVNWSSKFGERYTVQAGLRAEHTMSTGESVTTGQKTNREYLSLFPSLFVQQKMSENYQVNYSYSRRLQRPNYGNLNPFLAYRDPYTYWQGNPFLRPQYTHAIGVTQTYKKDYSLALNYQIIKDNMAELALLDVQRLTTVYTIGNVDDAYNLSANLNVPVKIMKNWDTQNSMLVSYNKYKVVLNQEMATNDQVHYQIQSTNNILLPRSVKLEVNTGYRGPAAYGIYRVASQWWFNVGVKKSFLDDKLALSVNVNDIFKGMRVKISTVGRNVHEFDQYFRARSVGINLRYNFSRGEKFDPKRQNNNLEELNRT